MVVGHVAESFDSQNGGETVTSHFNALAAFCFSLALACINKDGQNDTTQSGSSTTGNMVTDSTPPETTEDVGDSTLYNECVTISMNNKTKAETECQCAVDQGSYPDIPTCLADTFTGIESWMSECTCQVYSEFPETKSGLDCIAISQSWLLDCLEGLTCKQDPTEVYACIGAYEDAVAMCVAPPKDALSQEAIQCNMIPAAMCASGEAIPETWLCDYNGDCKDLSDELGCPASFMCMDGKEFIPGHYKCNGASDCADASDEASCLAFKCDSGPEIPEKFRCDGLLSCCGGNPDCSDMSDETNCPTFMCMNGQLILLLYQCDGKTDCCIEDPDPECADVSDENDCPMFICMNGEAIPAQFRCDDWIDCRDASDEIGCP